VAFTIGRNYCAFLVEGNKCAEIDVQTAAEAHFEISAKVNRRALLGGADAGRTELKSRAFSRLSIRAS